MNRILLSRKNEISALCRQFGIKSLYVFGSAVRDDFSRESDIDFLYEFENPGNDPLNSFERLLELKNQFQTLLGRKVDMIQYNQLDNPYLKHFINQEKVKMYGEA